MKNEDGDTALHLAVLGGKDELAEKLIKAGARVNLKNKEGDTPIKLCEYSKFGDKMSKLLLKHGASASDLKDVKKP